jgi:CRISPR system Cascade subunit CasE
MNLFLSKIEIDYEAAHKIGLRDSHDWHRWVWQAFPNRPDADRDFLTRLDDLGNGFRLLVQSREEPHRPPTCPAPAWESKSIPEAFFTHSTYRFSLLANPTKKVRSNAKGELLKNSRRVPLSTREDLLDWLQRKATQHGFALETSWLRTIPRPRQIFVKKSHQDDRRHTGLHTSTEFTGLLTITDPALFRQAIETGIGPAKAFGFGMLCLSPTGSTS